MPRHSNNIKARSYTDRHGRTRWRVRVGKSQRNVPPPSAPDHLAKIAAAVLDMTPSEAVSAKYTLSWMVADYQASSPVWRAHGPKTRKDKSALLKRMEDKWGIFDMRTLTEEKLSELMDAVKSPATHNRMKTLWSQMFDHMKKRGWRKDNPSKAIERRKWKVTHTHIWTDAERAQYCEKWPVGSKPRAAYHLMFDTRQACADAAHMAFRMESQGVLRGDRVKTGGTYTIVISDDMEAAIAPFRSLSAYLLTSQGKPYSERGLHNYMSKWIGEAGLPSRCTPHGLRGAGLTKDAEAGATESELMNTGGFENSSEVKIYTREASRVKLAKATAKRRKAVHRKTKGGTP